VKEPTILSGRANPGLAEAIAVRLGVRPVERTLERFPDSELHVEIEESVRGRDVFLVQPTSPPVETNLFEILFLADARRRSGAARLTAVIPRFRGRDGDGDQRPRRLGARLTPIPAAKFMGDLDRTTACRAPLRRRRGT
jgi:phosphoribosylpyrophosphate synthetase